MNLADLRPCFVRVTETGRQVVESLEEAQGVSFLCPKCFARNGGPKGTHVIICWSRSRGAPDSVQPGPGRWALAGTGLADLTLNADPPSRARSVLLTGGCGWHGFITKGRAHGDIPGDPD